MRAARATASAVSLAFASRDSYSTRFFFARRALNCLTRSPIDSRRWARLIFVAARGARLKRLFRPELVGVATAICLVAVVVGVAFFLTSPHESGVKGMVRCASSVASCRLTPNKAVVYVMFYQAPFNSWNPPTSSYETDAQGRFQIPLTPGTYWLAAEKQGGVFASDKGQEVVVRAGAMTDVTIDIDLCLPQ